MLMAATLLLRAMMNFALMIALAQSLQARGATFMESASLAHQLEEFDEFKRMMTTLRIWGCMVEHGFWA